MAPSTTAATCVRAANIDGTYSQQDPTYTSGDRIIRHRKMTSSGEQTREVIRRAHLNDPNAEGPARNEPEILQRGLIQPRRSEDLTLGVSNHSNPVPRNTLKSTAPSYLRSIPENSSDSWEVVAHVFQIPGFGGEVGVDSHHLHSRQSVSVPTLEPVRPGDRKG